MFWYVYPDSINVHNPWIQSSSEDDENSFSSARLGGKECISAIIEIECGYPEKREEGEKDPLCYSNHSWFGSRFSGNITLTAQAE
jgi:hypothetical protein